MFASRKNFAVLFLLFVFSFFTIGLVAVNPVPGFAVDAANDSEVSPISLEIIDVPQISLPENEDFQLTIRVTNNSNNEITLNESQLTRSRDWAIADSQLFKMITGESTQIYMTSPDISGNLAPGKSHDFVLKIPATELNWIFSPYQWRPYGFELCVSGATTSTSEQLPAGCDRGLVILSASAKLQPMPLFSFASLNWPQAELPVSPLLSHLIADDETSASNETEATNTEPVPVDDSLAALSPKLLSPQFITDTNQAAALFIDIAKQSQLQLSLDPSLPINQSVIDAYNNLPASARNLIPIFNPDYPSIAQHLSSAEQFALRNETLNTATEKNISGTYETALLSTDPDVKTGELFTSFGINQIVTNSAALSTTITSTFNPDTRYQDDSLGQLLNILAINPFISKALAGTFEHSIFQTTAELSPTLQKLVPLAMTAVHYNQAPSKFRAISIALPDSTFTALATQENTAQAEATLAAYQALIKAPWLKPTAIPQAFNENSDTSESTNSTSAGTATTTTQVPDTTSIIQELPTPLSETTAETPAISQEIFLQLQQKVADIQSFAGIFTDPENILKLAQIQKWALLSSSWNGSEDARKTALNEWYSAQESREKLTIAQSAPVNMISDQASLPLQVFNPYRFEVHAKLSISAPNYRLNIVGEPEVLLAPHQTSAVSVPVKAHGAGTIEIKLQLIDDAKTPVSKETQLEMRLHPSWENTGTAIAAALVFGVLLLGVFKSIRSGRRADQIK